MLSGEYERKGNTVFPLLSIFFMKFQDLFSTLSTEGHSFYLKQAMPWYKISWTSGIDGGVYVTTLLILKRLHH